MIEMIPFYLIFPNVLIHIYTSETINYVYIIFRAGYPENRIISSANRHHSYISLARHHSYISLASTSEVLRKIYVSGS